MSIKESLENLFDELRAAGNDIPLDNRQCAILVLGGLETLDFGKVADELLGPAPEEDEESFETQQAYDKMADDCATSCDGIVNDLRAVIDEWEGF